MAEHNQLGIIGEEEAAIYLSMHDYRLLEKNWRIGHLEIDLVADHFGEIVFIEVKTRRHEGFFTALGAVDIHKKRKLVAAAKAFMNLHHLNQPYRFDIITLVGDFPPFKITHYKDAYSSKNVVRKFKDIPY